MTTPEPVTAPVIPRAPRKLRTARLAAAAERTGDAPETPAEGAPEATVAVLEPAPEPTWHRTIGDMVEAKFARWHEAVPRPPITPVPAAELPPLPPLPVSPQPVGLTAADREFLAGLDVMVATAQKDIDLGIERARRDIAEIHLRHQPALAVAAAPAEPAPVLAAKEQHHDTGPHPWLDTMALELGEPSEPDCADGEVPSDG